MACPVAALVITSVISYGQSNEKDEYQKWSNGDVTYIITPYEKKEFPELGADEERERYIEAFWQRRDPDMDTEGNESREEYSERLAHADKNFAFEKVAGWRTGRGRTYIPYGERNGTRKTRTGELWNYRFIAGVKLPPLN